MSRPRHVYVEHRTADDVRASGFVNDVRPGMQGAEKRACAILTLFRRFTSEDYERIQATVNGRVLWVFDPADPRWEELPNDALGKMRIIEPHPGLNSWLLLLSPKLEEAKHSLEDVIGAGAHELAHAFLGHPSVVQPTDDTYNREHSAMLEREVQSWQQVVDWGVCATARKFLRSAKRTASLGRLMNEIHEKNKEASVEP